MCNALSMSINSATTSKMKRILGRLSYVSEVGRKRINTIRDHNSSVKTLRPTSSREEYAQSALAQRNIFSFMSKEQLQTPPAPLQIRRYASNLSQENCNSGRLLEYLHFHQETSVETREAVSSSFVVLRDFVTEEEEKTLLKEVEPHLKRLHYEHDHWDDAIHGFRETERSKWGKASSKILAKLQEFAFPNQDEKLALVHILDLAKTGVIKPHVDSIRFCGNTICGLCLLSDAVMRLVNVEDKTQIVDIMLWRRSLYLMKDASRYNYTHEVLGEKESYFGSVPVPRERRISIMCRNYPREEDVS
ncbi:alpha-ketoglutarate-dependent dioxygenase alkB homolog 7, mitochondrial-like isoform X2 [Penaeus chinensis]|uniref:alpha-ketoglutarate-dependent dioxygenase alkB homolog 7, mitochondrial-like isoform X2 n=1 Tax=Penaeus chinensis TaxID=139456 RepID=UPI001FB64B8A|nr:alpha-ketoglutarate-dependent dioxygenase alkB homolog 7, mitochondrial-like isoform X2 [Penaeus chinensis]XP_047500702.1 alpha-ketoglutarate-dependent dioxygenase alkB homolog 7, mitochondrial-like isoform X2 [Penaeus chinensis]XP_047500703.1 alpha-ketoglutarate-dependent dioxygenase alkB homolog 7, mitochondrial-like isoform X2 [Penaeus chinensis]